MIERLIAWCAHNKWSTLGLTLALCGWGLNSLRQIPIDAIPDLSDTQVIVYSRWDRSPDVIENQVSYPIVQALLGVPKVKNIRAFSDFGYSYVYAIFQDGTDLYWARSRVLEYLAKIQGQLPEGGENRARPGRHRRGLGLPVRPAGQERQNGLGGPAQPPGLEAPLRAGLGARRGRSGQRRRLCEAAAGAGPPLEAPALRRGPYGRGQGGPGFQCGDGRPRAGAGQRL